MLKAEIKAMRSENKKLCDHIDNDIQMTTEPAPKRNKRNNSNFNKKTRSFSNLSQRDIESYRSKNSSTHSFG